jgi:hypothetical protein
MSHNQQRNRKAKNQKDSGYVGPNAQPDYSNVSRMIFTTPDKYETNRQKEYPSTHTDYIPSKEFDQNHQTYRDAMNRWISCIDEMSRNAIAFTKHA